ncbi:hypothetical protein ES705_33557 [subsurface metagenome]
MKIVAIVDGYHYFKVSPWYEVYYNLTAIIPGEVNGLIIPAESFSYEYGVEGNTIIWKIIDKNVGGTTYSINHDDIVNETGSWTSNIDIIHNIDGLFIGNHNITIEADDGLGDFYFDNVSVNVFNKAPMIEYQGNTTIIKGSQGNYLKWNISDYSINPSNTSYVVYKNTSLILNNTWQKGSNVITYPIDNLTVGNYEFNLTVNDGLGIHNERVEDIVNIQVIQNTNITINYPSNITYEHYDTGNFISWDITDSTTYNPKYIIYHDGIEKESGAWQSGVIVNHSVDGLDIGISNISIIAFDGCGLNITSWITVNVTPCIDPILTPPIPEEVYLLGKSLNLRWIVLDDTINSSYTNYSIFHNDILNKTGTWQSNDTIIDDGSFNISGFCNITIMVFDGFGKNATDSLIVTILQPNNNQWQNLAAGSHVLWCANSDEIYIRMSLTNTNNCSVKINGSINDPLSTSFDKGLLYYSVEVTNSLNVVFPVTTRFYIPAFILGSYPRGNLTLYHYNGTDWARIPDIELNFPSDKNWVEYNCPSFSFYALGLTSSSSDGGNGDGDGDGDGSDDFWNNTGGILTGVSIGVGAGIIIGIIVVINIKATAASSIETTQKTKKKLKKMKLKFDIDKLRNTIQEINEIIEELSEDQRLKIIKQIKNIIKKIIQKDKKSIEELAGELIKSHLLIKKDNITKAERKTKRVLKIAEKQNFEIIIKEANNIIKKIHKKSEER